MGRGNWRPRNREDSRYVYVELLGPGDPSEADKEAGTTTAAGNDLIEEVYALFQTQLEEWLPCSFVFLGQRERPPGDVQRGRDEGVVAYNGLVALTIDTQGEFYHQGVALVTRDDAPAFAAYYLDRLADRLFDKLADHYRLYNRATAWTCSPYRKTRE